MERIITDELQVFRRFLMQLLYKKFDFGFYMYYYYLNNLNKNLALLNHLQKKPKG